MDDYIVIGALSNLLFGLKSLPQVLKCYKQKSTNGLSLTMILCDFGGNIGCSYYLYSTVKFAVVFQYINYALATIWLIVLLIQMIVYRKNNNSISTKE